MKKIWFIIILFSLLFLNSCGKENPKSNSIITTTNDVNSFEEEYYKKISFTLKPNEETYIYNYVFDTRIQIKPKKEGYGHNYIVKFTIYDGEATDPFAEVIIIRYIRVFSIRTVDITMSDIYTYEVLTSLSYELDVVEEIEEDYNKNFLNSKFVWFNSMGGDLVFPKTFSIADKKFPNNPSRQGCLFDGWYSSKTYDKQIKKFDDLEDGMTLYAKWEPYNLNIWYHVEDDVINPNVIDTFNVFSDDIILYDASREGYSFDGWYIDKYFSGEPIRVIPSGSYVSYHLYPKWIPNNYNVELVYNDGITDNEIVEETYNSEYILPIPSRDGYVFEGWYLDENDYDSCVYSINNGEGEPSLVNIPKNHKLYAKWVEGTSGLLYDKVSVGYRIMGCSNKDATSIIIPEKICGEDVAVIYEKAFSGMNKVKTVIIPNSVIAMGRNILYECSSVETLVTPIIPQDDVLGFPTSVAEMFGTNVNGPYYDTSYDTSLYNKVTIKPYDGASYDSYYPKSFKNFKITSALIITDFMLMDINTLCNIEINDGVTTIGKNAFRNLTNLEEIIIPNSVISINNNAFLGCDKLSNIYFAGKEEEWNEIDISSGNDSLNNADIYWYSENKPDSYGFYWRYVDGSPTIWIEVLYAPYKVEHYLQNIDDDNYPNTPYEIDNLTGKTDTQTNAQSKMYEGFTLPEIIQNNIDGDGSTVIRLYYIRNTYTILLSKNIDKGGTLTGSGTYKYGKEVTITATTNPGYTFNGWYDGDKQVSPLETYTFNTPAENLDYTAKWTANTNTTYKVEHYLQNLDDDNYPTTPYEVDNLTGTTDTLTNGSVKTYEGFTSQTIIQVNINGDGSTVIKLNYTRNTYTVNLRKNIDKAGTITGAGTYKYGKEITITATTNPGYTFVNWNTNDVFYNNKLSFTHIIEDNNLVLEAIFEANTYEVSFTSTAYGFVEEKRIYTYDSEFELYKPILNGYYFVCYLFNGDIFTKKDTWEFTNGGTFVLMYEIINYDITYTLNGGTNDDDNPTSYTIVDDIFLKDAEKEGYTFIEWILNGESVSSITSGKFYNNLVLEAIFEANTYKVNYMINGNIYKTSIATYDQDYSFEFVTLSEGKYEVVEWRCKEIDNIQFGISFVWKYTYNIYFEEKLADISDDFTFVIDNNKARISSYNKNLKDVYIADYALIDGEYYKVGNSLVSPLFDNNQELESIRFPEGMSSLDTCYNCNNLKKVVFSEGNEYIPHYAFAYCDIEDIIIPSTVKEICDGAFMENPIKSVTFSKGSQLIRIGECAFSDDGSGTVEKIIIPASVEYIGIQAFDIKSLNHIEFEEGSKLLEIDDTAFCRTSILKIVIPDKVTTIGLHAFADCKKLEIVEIPNSLLTIGENLFYNCNNLQKVYYNGTYDEWNTLLENSSLENSILNGAKLYVLEGGDYLLVDI